MRKGPRLWSFPCKILRIRGLQICRVVVPLVHANSTSGACSESGTRSMVNKQKIDIGFCHLMDHRDGRWGGTWSPLFFWRVINNKNDLLFISCYLWQFFLTPTIATTRLHISFKKHPRKELAIFSVALQHKLCSTPWYVEALTSTEMDHSGTLLMGWRLRGREEISRKRFWSLTEEKLTSDCSDSQISTWMLQPQLIHIRISLTHRTRFNTKWHCNHYVFAKTRWKREEKRRGYVSFRIAYHLITRSEIMTGLIRNVRNCFLCFNFSNKSINHSFCKLLNPMLPSADRNVYVLLPPTPPAASLSCCTRFSLIFLFDFWTSTVAIPGSVEGQWRDLQSWEQVMRYPS